MNKFSQQDAELWLDGNWPCTITMSRYGGTYSGGIWLAFPEEFTDVDPNVLGDDISCMEFFANLKLSGYQYGRGRTPELALKDLRRRMGETSDKRNMQ